MANLMRRTGGPNGLSLVRYSMADIGALVEHTFPQKRIPVISLGTASRSDLRGLFKDQIGYLVKTDDHPIDL